MFKKLTEMVLAESKQVPSELIKELRQRFVDKCENEGVPVSGESKQSKDNKDSNEFASIVFCI